MKVYIGNLPADLNKEKIEKLLEDYGDINQIELNKQIVDSQLIQYAIIEIVDDKLAKKAIRDLDNYKINGKKIQVNEARTGLSDRRGKNRVGGRRDYDPKVIK